MYIYENMRSFKQIDFETEIAVVSKFNQAALELGLSVFDLYYDGKSFYKHILEDDFFQEVL